MLFVTDSLEKIKSIANGSKGSVLALGIDLKELELALNSHDWKNLDLIPIDYQSHSSKANKQVRIFYENTLAPLWEKIRIQNRSSKANTLFYFLNATENSPFKGKLTNRLYFLSVVKHVLEDCAFKEVNYILKDRLLQDILERKQSVNVWKSFPILLHFVQILRFFAKTLVLKRLIKESNTQFLDDKSVAYFTIYPYWWTNPMTEIELDRFFPNLNLIASHNFVYLTWHESGLRTLLEKTHQINQSVERQRFLSLHNFLKIRHFLGMFNPKNVRYLQRIGKIENWVSSVDFAGTDVRKLLEYEIQASIASGELVRSRLIQLAMSNILMKNKIAAVIFRFENQPVDRALILASKGHTKAFAYWHSTLSLCDNYLSLQNTLGISPTVINDHLNEIYPDKFLSANSFCTATLERQGVSSVRIAEIGPTRQWKILEQLAGLETDKHGKSKFIENKKNESLEIIICFSADKRTSLSMIISVITFFESVSEIEFYLKPHPAWFLEQSEVEEIKSKFGRKITVITNSSDFYVHLEKSTLIITAGTQLAFESIMFNTMPIVFESQSQFVPTNFDRFENVCFLAHDFTSLNNALDAINGCSDEFKKKVRNWPAFLDKFIGDVDYCNSTKKFNLAIADLINLDT